MMSIPADQALVIRGLGSDERLAAPTRRRTGPGVGQERPGPLDTRGGRGEWSVASRRSTAEARITERRLDSASTTSRTYVQSGIRASGGPNDGERIMPRVGDLRNVEASSVRVEHENSPCERHSHLQAPCGCCLGHGIPARPPDCSACGSGSQSQKEQSKVDSCRDKLRKTWLSKRQKDVSEDPSIKRVSTILRAPPAPAAEPLGELDVDELVRRIEGTSVSGNTDPKKAAKKARQKEKKVQMKIEEDRQRELEEKLKREEEARIVREKLEREAEELRLIEEQKRMARKAKKKNKKQRTAAAAAASSISISNTIERTLEHQEKHVQSKVNANGTVTLTLNPKLKTVAVEPTIARCQQLQAEAAATAVSEPPPTGMVTIRRCSSKENLVTITSATSGGKKENLLYYLLDGQLYSYDSKKKNANEITCQSTSASVDATDAKKKKNKSNKSGKAPELRKENFVTITATQTFGSRHQPPIESSLASFRQNGHSSSKSSSEEIVDIEKIRLPPGITITKVESGISDGIRSANTNAFASDKSSNRKPPSTVIPTAPSQSMKLNENEVVVSTVRKTDSNDSVLHYIPSDDLDLFGPKETEEFEEVVSYKTRKNRQRAAKVKQKENTVVTVSEETDSVRSSPSRGSVSSRHTPPFNDRSAENGTKRHVTNKPNPGQKSVKPLKPNARSCNTGNNVTGGYPKTSNSSEKLNVIVTNKRDSVNFQKPCDNFVRSTNPLKVMPRLSRPETTNGDFFKSASSTKENYDPYGTQLINRSLSLSNQPQSSPTITNHDSEHYKALLECNSMSESWTVAQPQRAESDTYAIGTHSNNIHRHEPASCVSHGEGGDFIQQSFKTNSHLDVVNTVVQSQNVQPEGSLQNPALNKLPMMSKGIDQSWSPWGGSGVWTAQSPDPGNSPSPRFDVGSLPMSDPKNMSNSFFQKVSIPIQRPTPSSSADITVDPYVGSDETLAVGLGQGNNEPLLSTTQYFGQSNAAINSITNGMDELRFDPFDSGALMNAVLRSNGSSLSSNLQQSNPTPENVFNELDKQVNAKGFSVQHRNPWENDSFNGEPQVDPPLLPDWDYQSKNWGPSNYSKGSLNMPKQTGGNRYAGNRSGMAPQVVPKENSEWYGNYPPVHSPTLEPPADSSFRNLQQHQQQRRDVTQPQFNILSPIGVPMFPNVPAHPQWGQSRQSQPAQSLQTPYFQAQGTSDNEELDYSYWQDTNHRMHCPEVSVQLVNNAPAYGHVMGSNPDYSGGTRH